MKKFIFASITAALISPIAGAYDTSDVEGTGHYLSGGGGGVPSSTGDLPSGAASAAAKFGAKQVVKGAGKVGGGTIDLIWPGTAHAPTHDGYGGGVSPRAAE